MSAVTYKIFFGDSNIRMFQHLSDIDEKFQLISYDEYTQDSMSIHKYNYTNGTDILISVFSFVGASALGLSKEKNSRLLVGEHITNFLKTLQEMKHEYKLEVYFFFGCVDIDFILWYQESKGICEFIEYAANGYIDFVRILKRTFKGIKIKIMGIHPPSVTDEFFEEFCKSKSLEYGGKFHQSFEHRKFYHDIYNKLLSLYCKYDAHVQYITINDQLEIPEILKRAIENSLHDVHVDLKYALSIWHEKINKSSNNILLLKN